MSLKSKLLGIRSVLINEKQEQIRDNNIKNTQAEPKDYVHNNDTGNTEVEQKIKFNNDYELDDKVDNFINWYSENMVKGNYTKIGEFSLPKDLRNFIEKMAVWYELRYIDSEVNKMMPCAGIENIDASEVMFKDNSYIKEYLDNKNTMIEYNEFESFAWDKFYNIDTFINTLCYDERKFLDEPSYPCVVCLDPTGSNNLQLSDDGFVLEFDVSQFYNNLFSELNFNKPIHIKDIFNALNKNGKCNAEIIYPIETYEKRKYFKDELLNCVMYRIIERGGSRIGPRRAFLFAKEFNRSIDIPMMYGIDYSDPRLKTFIDEYIKAGGSKDLKCLIGYFSREKKNQKLQIVTIDEIIKTKFNQPIARATVSYRYKSHQKVPNTLVESYRKKYK